VTWVCALYDKHRYHIIHAECLGGDIDLLRSAALLAACNRPAAPPPSAVTWILAPNPRGVMVYVLARSPPNSDALGSDSGLSPRVHVAVQPRVWISALLPSKTIYVKFECTTCVAACQYTCRRAVRQ
jgi:hypothetical protein